MQNGKSSSSANCPQDVASRKGQSARENLYGCPGNCRHYYFCRPLGFQRLSRRGSREQMKLYELSNMSGMPPSTLIQFLAMAI